MVNINIKNKKITILIGMVITSFIIFLLVGYFVSVNQKAIQTKQERSELLKEDLNRLDKILSQKNILEKDMQKITRMMPKNVEEVAYAVSQIENIAKTNNVNLEITIDEDSVAETVGASSVRMLLKTTGSFSSHEALLAEISKLPYFIRFDSIQMDKGEGGVTSSITIRLFIVDNKTIKI